MCLRNPNPHHCSATRDVFANYLWYIQAYTVTSKSGPIGIDKMWTVAHPVDMEWVADEKTQKSHVSLMPLLFMLLLERYASAS
jgi:hypothetical protein